MSIRIFLGGVNITEYVPDKPKITSQKEFGKFTVINSYKVNLLNENDLFTIGNPNSIIGTNPIGTTFLMQDDASGSWETIFSGELVDGPEQKDGDASILVPNFLMRYLNEETTYSGSGKTAAEIALTILDDVPSKYIDSTSFANVHQTLYNNSVFLNAVWKEGGNKTIVQALNDLALFSSGYLYTYRNKIYFKLRSFSNVSPKSIYTEDDFDNLKRSVKQTKYMWNDYSIEYANTVTKDVDNNSVGLESRNKYKIISTFTLNGGTGESIEIVDLTSAVWIGESVINANKEPVDIVKFNIQKSADKFNLETIFALSKSKWGYDNATVFDVMTIKSDPDKEDLEIIGREVIG